MASCGEDEKGTLVAIRMRPLNERETSSGQRRVWRCLPAYSSITQTTPDGNPLPDAKGSSFFTYDRIFGESCSNEEVYAGVAMDLVAGAVAGVNGTIFAYGQTSSGKTFTMQGAGEGETRGVVHMASAEMFRLISETPGRDFLLRVSYLEIYNEEIRDLLNPETPKLHIREDPRKGVYVDSREEIVTDYSSILQAMSFGENHRHVFATDMNARSSRSHTIVRIVVESKERFIEGVHSSEDDVDDAVRIATLNLVDLAGSESVRHTGATGQRQKEGGKINQSLLSLSRVIQTLSQGGNAHVNFRDSKLTRILQPSLSGNASMAIICCVTPAEGYLEETRSTLQFAQRAKMIKTHAMVNEVLDERAQLKRLKRELAELKEAAAEANIQIPADDLQGEVQRLNAEKMEQAAKIEKLTALILTGNSSTQHEGAGSGSDDTALTDAGDSVSRVRRIKRARETWCPGEFAAIKADADTSADTCKRRATNDCFEALSKVGTARSLDTVESLKRDLHASKTKISELTERIQALENCDSSGTSAIEEQLRARAEEAEEELKEFAAYTDEIEVEKSRLEAELASRIADLSTAEEIISSMEDFIKKLESRTDQPTPMALMQMVAEYCGSSTCENSPSAMCGNVKDSAVEYKSLEKLEAQKVLAEEAAAALRSELDVLAASSAAEIADLRASLADLQRHEAIGVSVDAHLAGNSSPDASEDNSIKVSDPYDALAISDDEISDDEQGNAPLHVCQENNSGLSDKSSCAGATEHIGKNVLEAQIGELQQRLVTLSEAERVSFELKEAVISLQSRVQEQDLAAAQAMEEKAEKENRIAELLTQISMGALESDPDGITKDVQTDEDQERKELQQQCIKFREESACYETCVGMLEEDLLAAKAELAALVSETKKKNFDFDGLSREISAKQEELQNANADLESLVAHLRMQYNTASLELEEKTQELHALAEEASAVKLLMEQRIADLEGEAASTAQTLQELSAKPDSTLAASQIAELKACLGSLQNEKATLADALQEATLHLDQKTEAYTAQIAELQANMEEARAQRCDLEGSLQELCLRLECLQGEAATSQSYEEVLKHAQCEVADRTADVLRLQEQHALLEEDATAYRTKLHDVSSALSQAQVDGHEKSATILSLRMHVELLTVSARAAEHRGALAEERAVELESKKAAYDELAERITEERSLMETRILNMESALEETVLQKKEAEEALQVLADQIAEMEAAKSDADSLRDELTAALEESESLGKEVIELTEQMDVKSADISELRNKVDSLESLLQAAEDAAALHLAGLQQCRLELEKSELEATNLSDRLRELLESSATGVEVENELRLQLSELRAAIASLESEKCAALSQVGQLGANIAEYKEKFAEASSAMGLLPEVQLLLSKAENEKVEAKQVCLDLRSQVASLELELQATKQAVEGLQKLEEDLASRDKDADNLSERLAAAESALVTAIENERQGMHMLENTVAEAESVQADLLQKLEDALAEIKRTAARSNELAESLKRSEGNNSLLEQEVGSKTAALAELESAFDHLKHEQSGTESDELLREMELLMEGKLSAESRAAGMERELCELRESVQDAEQRAASEQKMVIKAAEERIANSISEVELLTEKIAILEADQEVKSERIKKLEEVRLTKEQVEKLNKMKETSKRNERQNRELSAEVTKLRQQLANGINKDAAAQLAELETIKESLSEKLRKYASHCQKLEGERGSLMAALQQAGVDIDASDDIAEAVYTLIEQRSVHSPSSDDEAAALRKQLSDGMTRYYQLENDFKRVQAELDKVVGERGEEEEEQTRQVRFLEGENLQLMLEIKEVKKQATQLRAELEALNSKHGEEASMTPSKLSSSTSRRQSSARVPRSASKSSTGNPCIEKENMVNMSAATSAAISAAKPGVVKKSRARALIEQGPEDESAGECKQS